MIDITDVAELEKAMRRMAEDAEERCDPAVYGAVADALGVLMAWGVDSLGDIGKPMRFMDFLGVWRRRHGITQAQFADMVGCSVAAVTQWEQGITSPTKTFRGRIVDVIGESALSNVIEFCLVDRIYRLDVTWSEFARRCGVSRGCVQTIIAGERFPNRVTIDKMIAAFPELIC